MKSIVLTSLVIITAGTLTGCGSNSKQENKADQNILSTTKTSLTTAVKKYHATYANTSITSVELEKTVGKPVYTIEGMDDSREYEVHINGTNGKVMSKKSESLDQDERGQRSEKEVDPAKVISLKKAQRVALKKVGSGSATEFSLSKETGITHWKVQVSHGNGETEVTINAKNGKVLATEKDD